MAAEIWLKDWPEEAQRQWSAPEMPRHDGPALTERELEERKDDVLRFYEQRHADGDHARLFAFNAATGESLTWEWDRQSQQMIIDDPKEVRASLEALPHWEGLEKMVNDKAQELAGEEEKPQAKGHMQRLQEERAGREKGQGAALG